MSETREELDDAEQRATRKFGRLLAVVGDLGQELHGQGVIDLEQLRLTIPARQAEAKRLVANGQGIRKIAKELGVEKSTIQRDLGLKKVELKAPKVELKAPKVSQSATPGFAPERWQLSMKGCAYDATRLREYWDREFPGWKTYTPDEETVGLVEKAISEWSEILSVVKGI